MNVVVLARDLQLAALVKERFDCRKVGLTQTVRAVEPEAVEQAVQTLRPSVIVLVGHDLDSVALDVCERLSTNPRTNHIPLIATTELATEDERIAVLEAGADSVVLPLNLDAVEWRVRTSRARTDARRAYRGKELSFEGDGSD